MRAQQSGEFPAVLEPDATARVLIALFHGFILQQSWDDSTRLEPFLTVARAAFEALINLTQEHHADSLLSSYRSRRPS
jgi:hypothetical protein